MSYIDDLNQAAAGALAASASATDSAQIMYDVANGDASTQVSTDGGPVDTLAKAIADIKSGIASGVLSSEMEEQTLASGQTTINLTGITLNSRPLLFIEGSFEDDFTVPNSTTIQLSQSFPAGTRVWILQNVILDSTNVSNQIELLFWQGI